MRVQSGDQLFAMLDAPMEQFGKLLLQVPMIPYLSTVHFIMTAIALRGEHGSTAFTRTHPIASCVLHVVVAMSGTMLSDLMLGRPFLGFVKNESVVLTGVIVWYMMYHFPGDLVYRFCQLPPVKLVLVALEELRRARNVMIGVSLALAMEEYKSCILIPAIVGMLKGTGKKWSISVYRVLSSETAPGFELLNLSIITKASFVLALFCSAQTHYKGIQILIGFVVLFGIKLWELLTGDSTDPLKGPQAAIWSILALGCHPETEPSQREGAESDEQLEGAESDKQRKGVWSDPQEEQQEDVQSDPQEEQQEDVQSDPQDEIASDTEMDIQSEIEKEIQAEMEREIEEDISKDIQEDIDRDIQEDINRDIQEDINRDIQADIDRDIQADIDRDMQSYTQKVILSQRAIQSDVGGEGDHGNDQSEEQDKEDEEDSVAKNKVAAVDDLPFPGGLRKRATSSTAQVVSSIECDSGSSPQDAEETNG